MNVNLTYAVESLSPDFLSGRMDALNQAHQMLRLGQRPRR